GMSPTPLFKSLQIAFAENPSMRDKTDILLMGKMNKPEIIASASKHGVNDVVQVLGAHPHEDAVRLMQSCHILLLFTGMVYKSASGKIFEYAASGRPVLSFGIQQFTRNFIEENKFGYSVNGNNPREGAEQLKSLFKIWSEGGNILGSLPEQYEKYSRPKLTQKLARLLDEVTK
ncbi:MAG: glycosyltransferase, partial [Candidatus Thorarchaeota archaeon]|nr:glycosyltransferase [Candidatus Thorarchaeota archaeon]